MIVDDEPLAVDLLKDYVEQTPFLKLNGTFTSPMEAMQALNEQPTDLLFLDIQMPGLSGLELSKVVPSGTRIIFTTAFKQYALDSYEVSAIDYLLKPIGFQQFLRAANKALQWFEMKQKPDVEKTPGDAESLFLKSDYKLVRIEINRILYVCGLKDYVKIVVDNDSHSIIVHMTMKAMEDMLPSDRFARVHRSYIVAMNKIDSIANNRIVIGKEYIPLSDVYKDAFMQRLS